MALFCSCSSKKGDHVVQEDHGDAEAQILQVVEDPVKPAALSPAKTPTPAAIPVSEELRRRFHGAIRWAKPWSDIEEIAKSSEIPVKLLSDNKDPANGNAAIHIAAQNGHTDLLRKLIAVRADVNAQNLKGNGPLHMSVEYDLYFASKLLLDSGALAELKNDDGSTAILGIDGGKVGNDVWDHPLTILMAANTAEELDIAFTAVENAPPSLISKEKLIQTGMFKKKSPDIAPGIWDHQRFLALAKKL